MTDNELIAEWLDWKLGEDALLRWDDCITCGKPTGERFVVFSPETDINLWHGSNGIFKQVEKLGSYYVEDFIDGLDIDIFGTDDSFYTDIFSALKATPAQLTAALIAVIKEE